MENTTPNHNFLVRFDKRNRVICPMCKNFIVDIYCDQNNPNNNNMKYNFCYNCLFFFDIGCEHDNNTYNVHVPCQYIYNEKVIDREIKFYSMYGYIKGINKIKFTKWKCLAKSPCKECSN